MMRHLGEYFKLIWYLIINILIFVSYYRVNSSDYFLTFVLFQVLVNSLFLFTLYQLGQFITLLDHFLKYNRFKFYTHSLNDQETKLVENYNISHNINHVNSFLEKRLIPDKADVNELTNHEKIELLNIIYYTINN